MAKLTSATKWIRDRDGTSCRVSWMHRPKAQVRLTEARAGLVGVRGSKKERLRIGQLGTGQSWKTLIVRANQDEEVYDYSTEKIRSLLKRDSKELKGMEDLGESTRNLYSDDGTTPESSTSTDNTAEAKPEGKAKAPSPSGAAPPISPFNTNKPKSVSSLGSQSMRSPFQADAKQMDVRMETRAEDEEPWWKIKITLTQVVLFCSFSLIIGLMILTFTVVVKSGAVRFNDT